MNRRKVNKVIRNVSRIVLAEIVEILGEEIGKKKRLWVRNWLTRRNTRGGSALLIKELYLEDRAEYISCIKYTYH